MIEILMLLLPIILELFGSKARAGEVKSTQDAIDCWRTPATRAKFVAELTSEGIARGIITTEQAVTFIVATIYQGDDPLMDVLIQVLYSKAGASND